jgi:hypothetical protein
MPIYEYKKVRFFELESEGDLNIDKLNELGADRWQLVIIMGGNYIFKREKRVRTTRYC